MTEREQRVWDAAYGSAYAVLRCERRFHGDVWYYAAARDIANAAVADLPKELRPQSPESDHG